MKKNISILLTFLLISLLSINNATAQRMKHGSGRHGGGHSINGGAKHSSNRPQTQQYNKSKSKPSTASHAKPSSGTKPNTGNRSKSNVNNKSGNTKIQGGDKSKNVSGNKTNIDRSNTNVNVNVDNSKDIHVDNRHSNNYYNGRRGYHPYYYHPYRPYYYGPYYHPVGFFVATMFTAAVIITIESQPQPYYYYNGIYYVQATGGYTVVAAPTNITVNTLPEGMEKITLNSDEYYYFGGAFYVKTKDSYKVIEAPDGAIITNIPDGGEEVEIDGNKYVKYNNTYFQPLTQDGKNMYQVVAVSNTAPLIQELPKETENVKLGNTEYYYSLGVFYTKTKEGYKVSKAPNGAVVNSLPDEAKNKKVDSVKYKVFNETYFQPLPNVGENVYQVVTIETK
jgi:hypothetical protein